ncbi:MAG: DNA translocase FtsK 4TM domain-containing protein, partial [Planctomycetota bacterium]
MIDFGRMLRDLLAVAVLAVVAFAAVSVATYDPFDPPSTAVYPPTGTTTNACGPAGARVAYGLITTFGVGAYALLGYAAALDLRLFSRRPAG